MISIPATARALGAGTLRARDLVERCLAQIAEPAGEGARAFLAVHAGPARARADRIDAARQRGEDLPPLAGIPVSIKDLFDETGHVTRAASRTRDDAAPAATDAAAVVSLKDAGLISIGRTVMTEFAFSGVGINPHFGTPANPFDRARGAALIPGGSSSGAVVSVTDGMAALGLGSDTGGSCRIPAALCGVVGIKPTQGLISRAGTIPLSTTLDSVGVMAADVAGARLGLRAAAGLPVVPDDTPATDCAPDLRGRTFGVLTDYVTDGMDATVTAAFDRALGRLRAAGATLRPCPFPELRDLPAMNARGGFAAPEALAWHQDLIACAGAAYDPFVLRRILRGSEQSAVDYIALMAARARLIATAAARMDAFDAVLMPTVPIVAPSIAALSADDARHAEINLLLLRNPSIVNILDRCAITLPCHAHGARPVGLSVVGRHDGDAALMALAAALEPVLRDGPLTLS